MKKRSKEIFNLNLDSLVDIVSNNVGILIILAVFMAILSLTSTDNPQSIPVENSQTATKKIEIPWTHNSQKTSLLFLLRDNKILYLERIHLYEQIKKQLRVSDKPETTVRLEEYSIKLLIPANYTHCLEFTVRPGSGMWWQQFIQSHGLFSQMLKDYAPHEFYYFFWVDGNSFELFKEIREYLWKLHFEVGWKPILPQSPLLYCNGLSRALSFQPQ